MFIMQVHTVRACVHLHRVKIDRHSSQCSWLGRSRLSAMDGRPAKTPEEYRKRRRDAETLEQRQGNHSHVWHFSGYTVSVITCSMSLVCALFADSDFAKRRLAPAMFTSPYILCILCHFSRIICIDFCISRMHIKCSRTFLSKRSF